MSKTLGYFASAGVLILLIIGSIFAVDYYEPTQRQAEQEANNQSEAKAIDILSSERVAYYTKVLAIFSGLLSGFGLLQIIFLVRTDKTARISADAAKTSADTLQVTERAFVVIGSFNKELTTRADATDELAEELTTKDPELQVRRFAVQPVWANNGSTPTKNMRINVDWTLGDQRRMGSYRTEDRQFFIAPKTSETDEFFEMPGLPALIQDGAPGIYGPVPLMLIWGHATYDDVFGKHHWIKWCYRVRPSRPNKGEKLRVGFIQWGDYNGSDEDQPSQ